VLHQAASLEAKRSHVFALGLPFQPFVLFVISWPKAMPTSIAIEAAADVDLRETAPDALIAIADVATLLGIRTLDRNFGTLGGELAALSEILGNLDSTLPEDKLERRIRKLLKELARACSVCEPHLI
jgi:hypothetical protein